MDTLLKAGANGARFTFSFGTPELQCERARDLRRIAHELRRPCLLIADLPGEKSRLGEFERQDSIAVDAGQLFTLSEVAQADPATGVLPVTDHRLLRTVEVGDQIIVGDGAVVLLVTAVGTDGPQVQVQSSGAIQHTRGLSVQSESYAPRALTSRDVANLRYVVQSEVFDAVAISFVSSASDVSRVRDLLAEEHADCMVISKIETSIGVSAAEEIAAASDAIMVARGDLALTQPWHALYRSTAMIADACERVDKPWIIATQVAEGLERYSIPTRPEISDLSHWLTMGAAGAMLSFETVFGSNPISAVGAVQTIIDEYARPTTD